MINFAPTCVAGAKWFKGGDIAYDPSSIYPQPDPSLRKPVKEVRPIDKSVDLESREAHPSRESKLWLIWGLAIIIVAVGIYFIVAF